MPPFRLLEKFDPPIYFTTEWPRCAQTLNGSSALDRCERVEGHDGMHRAGMMSWGVLETRVQIPAHDPMIID